MGPVLLAALNKTVDSCQRALQPLNIADILPANGGAMRKVFVLSITLLAAYALAQSDSEYQGWMKSNAANMGSLNKNLAAKDAAAVASDAQNLEATFKQVGDFWKKRGGVEDAVNFSMRGETAAAAIAKAATAGNLDEASAQVKNLQATCGGCHMAHREGSAGSFKIK